MCQSNQCDLISSVYYGVGDMPLQARGPVSELALNPLRHRYTLLWERYQSASSPTSTHTRARRENEITIILPQLIPYFPSKKPHHPTSFHSLSPLCSQFQVYTVETSCRFLLFLFHASFFFLFPFSTPLCDVSLLRIASPVCRQLTASFTFLCQFLLLPLSLSL